MRNSERFMGQLHAFGLFIFTTVAFTITVPVSAAALEEAHSRTELDLPPAVAEAIRETGEVTGDHATTAIKRLTKVVAAPERAQEAPAPVGPSTAAPSSSEATVSAEGEGTTSDNSEDSVEEDLAMNELLAILDEEDTVEPTLTFGQGQSIGTAGASPFGRAVPVTAFAVFCFLGLIAHPRTRKLALGRLTGAGDLRSQLDEIACTPRGNLVQASGLLLFKSMDTESWWGSAMAVWIYSIPGRTLRIFLRIRTD